MLKQRQRIRHRCQRFLAHKPSRHLPNTSVEHSYTIKPRAGR
jgi:hypothetical protein